MSSEVLVFKITGEWAHFKRPYTTTSPLTFDLPSPPSVLGYIGAILGLDKGEYLTVLNESCRVSIALQQLPQKVNLGLNFLHTKYSFRGYHKTPHAIIGTELIRDPAYLVFCRLDNEAWAEELVRRLQSRQPHYVPCLGLAWCLSDFEFLGRFHAIEMQPAGEVEVAGWLPKALVKKPIIEAGKRYNMMTLPTRMLQTRQVTDFADMIYEFSGKTIRCVLKDDTRLWRIHHQGALGGPGEQTYVCLV